MPAADEAPESLRRRKALGYLLAVESGLSFAAEVAVRQTGAQLWLTHFGGDTVAMALSRGRLMPLINVLSFCVTPVLGGLSDTIGRKPIMALAAAFQLCAFLAVLLADGAVAGLYIYELMVRLNQVSRGLSNRAAIGDLFFGDPALYASFTAVKELMVPAMKMVVPMAAGLLARRSVRLPFHLALVLAAVNGVLIVTMSEPLAAADRKPFSLASSVNPLGALELFHRGRRMSVCATMHVIDAVSESCAGPSPAEQLCELHRIEVLRWDAFQRGRWESVNSLFRTMGFVFTSGSLALPKLLGMRRALDTTLLAYIAQSVWLCFAKSSSWQFFATLPL